MIYGAGGLGLSFMQSFPQLSLAYAVDSDPQRKGERFHRLLPVDVPDALKAEDPDRLIVFITSSWHQEIRKALESLGLVMNRQIFFGSQQAHGRIFFHLPELSDFEKAFAWLDERGAESVILRWFESLPAERPADIDLLVRTEHLELLFENPHLSSTPGGVPLEVYWDRPLGQEDELLYYPSWLADEDPRLAMQARFWRLGPRASVPISDRSPITSSSTRGRAGEAPRRGPGKSTSTHFRKNTAVKLPASSRSGRVSTSRAVRSRASWNFLENPRAGFRPVDLSRADTRRRWQRVPGCSGRKVGPTPGAREDVLVFVLRRWLSVDRPEVEARVLAALAALGLRADRRWFIPGSIADGGGARAGSYSRGELGRDPREPRGGRRPAAFAVFRDPTPERPSRRDRLLRPFCMNRKLGAKTELKQQIARSWNGGQVVNFLHAADDEREALEYLDCLSPERRERVRLAIARVRGISARRGG